MTQPTFDLSHLFGAALETLTQNRQQVNDLDGFNGNHGDNMVENLRVITQALQARPTQAPADALNQAAGALLKDGRGSATPDYANGLTAAAQQLQGRSQLGEGDVLSLVQNLMGAVPAQRTQGGEPVPSVLQMLLGTGQPQPAAAQPQTGVDVLGQLLGAVTGAPQEPAAPQPSAGADLLGQLLGAATGQTAPDSPAPPGESGLGLDDVLGAGMSFMQARQSGADNVTALMQAAQSALQGGAPQQAGSPRTAAGGMIVQSILQTLLSRR
jgi:hypothetical protein